MGLDDTDMNDDWNGAEGSIVTILGHTAVHCVGTIGTSCNVGTNPGENNLIVDAMTYVAIQEY